jgi:hypothetical protein
MQRVLHCSTIFHHIYAVSTITDPQPAMRENEHQVGEA